MICTVSFSNENHEKFYRCPKCYSETKHIIIKDSELNFGEVLDKEIYKRK